MINLAIGALAGTALGMLTLVSLLATASNAMHMDTSTDADTAPRRID